ncbi:hypothetical protein ACIQ1D_14485 [Lysinibacillus xylanilyticus]|uniref:hypothetical protein n=1 Tax=Lysinibacillus xylanilyticus TaxID=582475 RepID=UPI0037F26F6B
MVKPTIKEVSFYGYEFSNYSYYYFILGLATPISFLYTLPISIIVFVFGLIRLFKK